MVAVRKHFVNKVVNEEFWYSMSEVVPLSICDGVFKCVFVFARFVSTIFLLAVTHICFCLVWLVPQPADILCCSNRKRLFASKCTALPPNLRSLKFCSE